VTSQKEARAGRVIITLPAPNDFVLNDLAAAAESSALPDSAATKPSDNYEQERRHSYPLKFHPNLTDGVSKQAAWSTMRGSSVWRRLAPDLIRPGTGF
jgi:hypothetical protein